MYKVIFVCYGNICRSPLAEMIFKDIIKKNNKETEITCISRATSKEEIGNDIYPQAKEKLLENNIFFTKHKATQITKEEFDNYDYIIVMEERNKRDLIRLVGEDKENKIHLLLEYTDKINKEIDDPWYTRDFESAYKDIYDGCLGLYLRIEKRLNNER